MKKISLLVLSFVFCALPIIHVQAAEAKAETTSASCDKGMIMPVFKPNEPEAIRVWNERMAQVEACWNAASKYNSRQFERMQAISK